MAERAGYPTSAGISAFAEICRGGRVLIPSNRRRFQVFPGAASARGDTPPLKLKTRSLAGFFPVC
jgi:hypothetical protein